MANYATLISAISNVIKTNGTNAITGAILQSSLLTMINSLGAGFQFAGVAEPSTNPGTPDQNVFYIGGEGTYSNFGGHVVPAGYLGVFVFNGSWTKSNIKLSEEIHTPVKYAECSVAGNVAAKIVTADNFELAVGAQIRIKFDYANTHGAPSLNVNSTGAKPLYFNGSLASAVNSWADGQTVLFYYDGTNWNGTCVYAYENYPAELAACETAANAAAKVVALPNFRLTNGVQMRVVFTNENTAESPTLNINGTGAAPIYYEGEPAGPANSWGAGETLLVYFDGTNWQTENAQGGGGGKFATGEKVKLTGISDTVEPQSDALVTGDAVSKSLSDKAGVKGTVAETIDNETIQAYIVGGKYIGNTGAVQTWSQTDILLMPITPGSLMAIRGLMIAPKSNTPLWLYNGNPNGGGGTPVATVNTSYLKPYDGVVFKAPENANYVGICINGRNVPDLDGNNVSFDSTSSVYAEIYTYLDLTIYGTPVVPVNKVILLEGLSGERMLVPNEKVATYIVANKGVNVSGSIVTWNKADLLIMPVEPGTIIFHDFQQSIALNVWLYDDNPLTGGVVVQTIENYPFPSVDEAAFEIADNVKYIVFYVAYRNVDGITFSCSSTIYAEVVNTEMKIADAFGKEIKDFVTLRATRNYTIPNPDMVQYFVQGKTINVNTGALTNWDVATSLVFPVIPGETVVFDGLQIINLPPDTNPAYGYYATNPTRGAVYPVLLGYHTFTPGEPLTLTIPDGVYYVVFLVACGGYDYNGQHYAFDSTGSIYATVQDGAVRRTIWGTPTGKEIEKRLSEIGGGGGGGAVSQSIDMGLPRDLPKVYIESELLTVVKDGQGNPTNQITPLTTSKNEVGDLDLENVTIRMVSESGGYDFEDAIVIAYQGQSSLMAAKKNFSIDTKHKHRFGKWLAMDGFHLKGYNSDWLHIRDIMANRVYEQMMQTRTPELRRPFCVENDFSAHDVSLLTEAAILCHIDGFPVELYINGDYWGLYSLNLKKHRSNYHLSKDDVKHIQIDPNWQVMTPAGWDWTLAEVRNPKSDSGNTEFIEGTVPNPGEVKSWWTAVLANLATITASSSIDTLRTFLNVESWVDIILLDDFIGDWDVFTRNTLYTTWNGNLLAALPYDHDGSFGIGRSQIGSQGYIGGDVEVSPMTNVFEGYPYQRCPWLQPLETALRPLIKERYAELRLAGVFSQANIKSMCNAWTMLIGFDAYKKDLSRWVYEGYGAGQTNPGFYDSTNRIIDWIGTRVGYLDNKYNYNG